MPTFFLYQQIFDEWAASASWSADEWAASGGTRGNATQPRRLSYDVCQYKEAFITFTTVVRFSAELSEL